MLVALFISSEVFLFWANLMLPFKCGTPLSLLLLPFKVWIYVKTLFILRDLIFIVFPQRANLD